MSVQGIGVAIVESAVEAIAAEPGFLHEGVAERVHAEADYFVIGKAECQTGGEEVEVAPAFALFVCVGGGWVGVWRREISFAF